MTVADHPTTVRHAAGAVLDRLVWHALTTTHAHLSQGSGAARRYDPEVAGFAAIEHDGPAAWAALAELAGPGEMVMLTGAALDQTPRGWERIGGSPGYQMVLTNRVAPVSVGETIVPLTAADVPQMSALVELTQPGPFRERTIELGRYYGVFAGDDLLAMAGERLQTPRFTEISAVCTHPSERGRGLASALTDHVARGILARRQTPILHLAQHNLAAKRVYERLGFTVRATPEFVAFKTPTTGGVR